MENFAQILDGLERDVLDLVSDLEIQIRKRIAVSGRTAPKGPAKPFEPKWRGLRGALRWLWKGQSKDNPDYAHLYNQDGTKKENSERRPTLAEYLGEIRIIDGFADEIFAEEFGAILAESFVDLSDLIVRFKVNFRNIILKYKNLIRGSVSVPAEPPSPAPSASKDSASKDSASAPPASGVSASEPVSEPPAATGSQPATVANKPSAPESAASDSSSEKEDEKRISDQAGVGGDKETEKTEPAQAEKAQELRKSKSHSANIKRWFEEAMEAKRKGGEELTPKTDWLNPKGIIKAEKLPWVIAWMGTKSHKDLHKDEDVKAELAGVLGSAFKDFVPQIAKKKSDSLVGYLRKKMPMASDEDFKKLVSDLYGSEYEGPGLISQKDKKATEAAPASEAEKEEKKPQEPDIQEIKIKALSSLYDGMDKKEQILDAIENKIVERAYDMMESDEDAEYFANWWKSFKRERMSEDKETVESLIARINSGAMFDDILKNSEVSKNKPEKKIKLRNLMDMLKD